MSRRGSPAVQILVVIVVVLFFLYGFYSYHEQHTRLKHWEEKSEKYKQKSESLSAQLQVLYEHKGRLENAVQEEKKLHKETKDSLELKVKELQNEQNQLIKAKESAEAELQTASKMAEENKKTIEKAQTDLAQLKQQQENEMTSLRDDVANFKRKYEECEAKRPSQPDGQQQKQAAQGIKAGQNVPDSNPVLQIRQPGDGQLLPEALPANNVQSVGDTKSGDTKGSNVDLSKNIPAPDGNYKLDSAPGRAPADIRGGEDANAGNVNKVELVQDQNQIPKIPDQIDVHQPAKAAEKVNVEVQDNQQESQVNENKVVDKDEDYAGDVEKPQQQQQQHNADAVGQVAKPAVNDGAQREGNEDEETGNEAAKDKDGAGL